MLQKVFLKCSPVLQAKLQYSFNKESFYYTQPEVPLFLSIDLNNETAFEIKHLNRFFKLPYSKLL